MADCLVHLLRRRERRQAWARKANEANSRIHEAGRLDELPPSILRLRLPRKTGECRGQIARGRSRRQRHDNLTPTKVCGVRANGAGTGGPVNTKRQDGGDAAPPSLFWTRFQGVGTSVVVAAVVLGIGALGRCRV